MHAYSKILMNLTEIKQSLVSISRLRREPLVILPCDVCRLTGLSRSRVENLIDSEVFQVRQRFGSLVVEIDSVRSWLTRRLEKESKRVPVRRAQK